MYAVEVKLLRVCAPGNILLAQGSVQLAGKAISCSGSHKYCLVFGNGIEGMKLGQGHNNSSKLEKGRRKGEQQQNVHSFYEGKSSGLNNVEVTEFFLGREEQCQGIILSGTSW